MILRHRGGWVIDLAVSGLLAGLVLTAVARSHDVDDFYRAVWEDNPIEWRFDSGFPMNPNPNDGNSFRARIVDGSREWNVLASPQRFEKLNGDSNAWGFNDCPGYMQNSVFLGVIDGTPPTNNTFAEESTCYDSTGSSLFIESSQIRFDQAETWFRQTSTAVPSNQVDALGVAVHEFGHRTGFQLHFEQDGPVDLCDVDSDPPGGPDDRQTMCRFTNTGDAEWRTLEAHDRHTFNAAYP